MASEKTVSLSFRVTPGFKRLLEAAAAREKRSLTNMLEVLLDRHCEQENIIDEHAAANLHGKGEAR